MKVRFAAAAERSLEQIADYIAADNPARARSFVRELREKALSVGEMPHAFPLASRFERNGIRRRLHGKYLILYRIDENEVVVIAFIHGARDYDVLLNPDG